MKKRFVAVGIIGILFICFFLTPHSTCSHRLCLEYGSIFSENDIEYGRFAIFMIIWLLIIFLSQFADFSFLWTEKAILFYRRLGSRIVDLSIIGFFIVIVGLILIPKKDTFESHFEPQRNIAIVRTFIIMSFIVLFTWMIYFTLLFQQGRTLGDRAFGLVQLKENKSSISFSRLFVREFIYALPAFICGFVLAAFQHYNYNGRSGSVYLHPDIIGPIFGFFSLLIYGIFPLVMLVNKSRQNMVDIVTKTLVRPHNSNY